MLLNERKHNTHLKPIVCTPSFGSYLCSLVFPSRVNVKKISLFFKIKKFRNRAKRIETQKWFVQTRLKAQTINHLCGCNILAPTSWCYELMPCKPIVVFKYLDKIYVARQ